MLSPEFQTVPPPKIGVMLLRWDGVACTGLSGSLSLLARALDKRHQQAVTNRVFDEKGGAL